MGIAVLVAAGLSTAVWASITTVSGEMTLIAPPPSVEFNTLESNTTQFAFAERQCVTLGSPLKVNISTPGTYDEQTDLTPAVIPAGTRVSSHFVDADKIGQGVPRIELEGTLKIDADILGIIVRQGALDASDFLGAIGTVYPTFQFGRSLALNAQQNDFVVLDADLRTVTLHTDNSFHSDQMRVIAQCAIPSDGSEGCTPGYWKQQQHFDSWKVYTQTDIFNTVFGVSAPFPNTLTLLDALGLNGGGANALARHAVAALLDSVNPDVDYGMTALEVIALTKTALESGDATLIEAAKNKLAAQNERGCPLN
jgi:hypothetical protein